MADPRRVCAAILRRFHPPATASAEGRRPLPAARLHGLTTLFELAKFSVHTLGECEKQTAVEALRTVPLPEAPLDRFLLRLRVGYPTPEDEQEILERHLQRRRDAAQVPAVTTRTELLAMQEALEDVF